MDRIALVIENNVSSSVLDYLDSCIEASNASIDEDVVKDEELEYKQSKLNDVKIPEFHKDFV
jgi:hypothetical protein